MKENYDISALRQMAADIKNAIKPQSITPNVVGGLFSALVEQQGEMHNAFGCLETETVNIKVYAYDGYQRIDASNAVVYVDVFNTSGIPIVSLPRQEVVVDANGEAVFEVYKGYKYAVFSKLAGMGASFQFIFEACQDARTIDLWHFPIGVFFFGGCMYKGLSIPRRIVPFISDRYEPEYVNDSKSAGAWDLQDDEIVDEGKYFGILISAANTSFVIERNAVSPEDLFWANPRNSAKRVPTLPVYGEEPISYVTPSTDIIELMRSDFDGNLNTEKMLSFCESMPAAVFCANLEGSGLCRQPFLPSAGQAYLMYLNRHTIESLAAIAGSAGFSFNYAASGYYISSTQYSDLTAVGVNLGNGITSATGKTGKHKVCAISSFYYVW